MTTRITVDEARQIALNVMRDAESRRRIACAFEPYMGNTANPSQTTITWIPVSERLPDEKRSVLFTTGESDGRALHGYRYGDEWHWCAGWQTSARHVTHWAEIPPAPTRKEDA